MEKLQRASEGDVQYAFEGYVRDLQLTEDDVQDGKSICVIGAGNNSFAAGLEKKYQGLKHAFVMGVDPAEKRYHQMDPVIINHDARELGFPSDFEGFDLVISRHAVPKYFMVWTGTDDQRRQWISNGVRKNYYDYTIADRSGSYEEAEEALYKAFSEMLRITKPGGRVKMYPFLISTHDDKVTGEEYVVQNILNKLRHDYPNLAVKIFNTRQGLFSRLKNFILKKGYITCGLELQRG